MPVLTSANLLDQYSAGKSMADIAVSYGVSVHKVAYWMKKYGIESRSRSEATYRKRNPNGDPFLIRIIDSQDKIELMSLGIALFIGEGTKKAKYGVKLANSDPRVINLFLSFLRSICGVPQEKIKAWINMFDENSYSLSLDYWSKQTGIARKSFYKPVIRPRKIGTYKNRSKYGTITILVNNKKLLDHIKQWSDDCLAKYSPVI